MKDYSGAKIAYAAWVAAFPGGYKIQNEDGTERIGSFPEFDKHELRIKDAWQAVYDAVKASPVSHAGVKVIEVKAEKDQAADVR